MPEAAFAERVAVVGISGAGKSTFARRLSELGYAHLELDRLRHQAGWRQAPDDEVDAHIDEFAAAASRWVIDGTYAMHRARIWPAADCSGWRDLPRALTTASCAWRSLRRVVTREELWNGNREDARNLLSLDPETSVVAWSFVKHAHYRAEFGRLQKDPRWGHLRWHHVRRRRAVHGLLAEAHARGALPLPPA